MDTFVFIISIFTLNLLIGTLTINIIDKKTKYVNNNCKYLSINYIFLFLFCNLFCFLFLNKIRDIRKIDYYKRRIFFFELFFPYDFFTKKEREDILKMKRYLKLKKIKQYDRYY